MRGIKEFFSEKKIPYTLFGIAIVAHLAVFYALLYFYGPCSFFLSNDCSVNGNDTQHYVVIAYNLTHGHDYSRFVDAPFEPDALRTPLIPLYFAPFAHFGGYSLIWLAILLLNIALSLAAPLVYKLARFFLSHTYAVVAGLCMALEPLYLYRSQIAEPDAILVLLLLASVFFAVRSWMRSTVTDFYRAAFLMGVAVLAKPTALYLALIIFVFEIVFLIWFSKIKSVDRVKYFAIGLLITCSVVAPWVGRNTIVFGVPAISSIQGYNLYEYYTKGLELPNESIPIEIQNSSREPSRYLPYQDYFVGVSMERIFAHPGTYAKEQAMGTLRNLFVSDIAQIYYYQHTRLLPFAYNPESGPNIHSLLSSGDMSGLLQAIPKVLPKIIWVLVLSIMYVLSFWGLWVTRREGRVVLAFVLFACLYGYLLSASGTFVEAKYRLPALILVLVAALYGLENVVSRHFLRGTSK